MMKGIASYSQIVLLLEYSGQLEYEFKWCTKHLTYFNPTFSRFPFRQLAEKPLPSLLEDSG